MQNQQNNAAPDFTALIRELGIDKLPREEQEEVLGNILETISMRVLTRISDALTDEQYKQIEALTEQDPKKANEALMGMVSNEQQLKIFQEEIDAVKEELKGLMAPEGTNQ